MFTLTGFVRSFITRKAYLLCLCTWVTARTTLKVTKWCISLSLEMNKCKTKCAVHLSTVSILTVLFSRQYRRSLCCTSTRHKTKGHLVYVGRVAGKKSHQLWNLSRKRQNQVDSATDTIPWRTQSLDVNEHVHVKSPQFSYCLQLFFDPLLWRKH